jgi:tRNA-specific 2-thiouridylase
MPRKILVAMSGGVDSSVAALLLQREGHEVTGAFFENGLSPSEDAHRVADQMGIPLHSIDMREEFEAIIRGFVAEYNAGRTPNPCVLCNRDVKFGRLAQFATTLGIETLATGHYARIEKGGSRWILRRAADPAKDQAYMLFALSQEQLSRIRLPLGTIAKTRTREIAHEAGLSIADRKESQEICFIPGDDYRVLLRERSPESFSPGEFRTVDGKRLGHHEGHQNFTVGQRKGLGVAMGKRMYVVSIDPEQNRVVLGEEEDLLRRGMRITGLNWVSIEPPEAPLEADVKVRYGQDPVPCRIEPGRDRADVSFSEPQKIITPGQAAVFYDAEGRVLGGGWIDSAL